MKKVLVAALALAVFTAPAWAELNREPIIIPKGAYTIEPASTLDGGTRGLSDGIYNRLTFDGGTYSLNNAGFFVGDDLHMTGDIITTIQWVYDDNGMGPNYGVPGNNTVASHYSTVLFAANNAADTNTVLGNIATFHSGSSYYYAVFRITGLPQASDTTMGGPNTGGLPHNPNGGWRITVNLPQIPTGFDAWAGFSSSSTNPTRLGLRGGGLNTVGTSHNLHWSGFAASAPYTGFFSMTGNAPDGMPRDGSFRWQVGGIPEPAAAALMAVGGLLMLRRRRA